MKRIVKFFGHYRLFSIAIISIIVGLLLYLSGQKNAAKYLIDTVAIIETIPLLINMYHDIQLGRYGVDILAATSIITGVILGQYWASIVVVLMLTGGQALEEYAGRRAQSELKALLKQAPQKANLLIKGKVKITPVELIKINDRIIIKAGEVVPVDGKIIDGQANFDESSITGESLPEEKVVSDQVLSGTINIDGVVTIRAQASAEDSQYQQIIKLVKGAAATKAPFVRLADRYSLPFTLIAFAIGLTVWILSGDAIRFLEVIIVATPCPLILAAPTAFISGMARASKYGIIVKTGKSFERLAEAVVIAFDKTGTLTKGELTLKNINSLTNLSENEVLKYAVSLEVNSNHVLAEAVVKEAKNRTIKPQKIKGFEEIAGLGIKANVKGKVVMIGSINLLKKYGVKTPEINNQTRHTSAFLVIDNSLVGIITFEDEIRPDTISTLNFMHKIGMKKIVMITGDNKQTADHIASEVGIDEVYADALPADKLKILNSLKPKPYIYVGDGVNDAPVLTAADVGIAMGAKGSTAASESADMVVMLDNISRVAAGVEIAKKTFKIAKQSILIGIVISTGLMLIFATGKFTPLFGAILQEGVDVFVIFNALRAHIITPSMIAK